MKINLSVLPQTHTILGDGGKPFDVGVTSGKKTKESRPFLRLVEIFHGLVQSDLQTFHSPQ